MNKLKLMPRSALSVEHLYSAPSVENAWDPLKAPASHTFSNNNKTVTRTATSTWQTGFAASKLPSTRKSAFEMTFDGLGKTAVLGFQCSDSITSFINGYPGQATLSGGIYIGQGNLGIIFKGANVSSPVSQLNQAAELSIGETIAFLYDPIVGSVCLAKNGILLNGGVPVWTFAPGLTLTPCYGLYPSAKVTLRSGAGALKYSYDGYSVPGDGGIAPNQGTNFFDAVNKSTGLLMFNNNRMATSNGNIGSYSTSFVTRILPNTKKSVFEFIVANNAAFSLCGLYFGADRTGPKASILGQTLVSSLGLDLYSGGGGSVTGNGCTRAVTTIGAVAEGDVLAFGWDPVAKTVVMWKNGVALNSGAPIWTGITPLHADGGMLPGITMNHVNGRVRLNPDLPSYDYGAYTN